MNPSSHISAMNIRNEYTHLHATAIQIELGSLEHEKCHPLNCIQKELNWSLYTTRQLMLYKCNNFFNPKCNNSIVIFISSVSMRFLDTMFSFHVLYVSPIFFCSSLKWIFTVYWSNMFTWFLWNKFADSKVYLDPII